MKFAKIYSETESRLRSALLSLWTPGHHPMRKTIDKLLHDEPLLAEPTFQSMFAWQPTQDTGWQKYLNEDVISRCEIGKKYQPYQHQTDSWQALKNGQSIVVTSGTGSGKTECFMYPVLSDLYEQQQQDPNLHAIQALFLYPLNALMEDQKKRLSNYCSQVGNLLFAVYNRNTLENHLNGANPLPCEVETRDKIRNQRPPILLTNPSMLEYILVRDKDQDMLAKSQGKLRWIILDEVHTYTGSAAVELAFQIKRILNAFGVTPDQVRFVCTSATVNDANGVQSLIDFISYVTGQNQGKISVIDGERLVPNIDADWLDQQLQQSHIPTTADNVITLRSSINQSMGTGLQQIWSILCPTAKYDAQEALELLDFLCELKQGNNLVLSLRAHFYMRSIEGLYACANDGCMAKNDNVYHFGHITTYKSTVCPHCGLPMMEILQCKRCGSFILSGDSESSAPHRITMHDSVIDTDDYFALDDTIEEEENDNVKVSAEEFFLLPHTKNYFNPKQTYQMVRYDITHHAKQSCKTHSNSGQWVELRNPANNSPYCPSCANLARGKRLRLKHFRIPVDFINQTIAPVLLQECGNNGNWGKYIAFTDSRQGTAISAKRFNVESERIYGRSRVTKELVNSAATLLPAGLLPAGLQAQVLAALANISVEKRFCDLSNYLFNQDIFNHLTGTPGVNSTGYKRALVRSFIGRRPLYETNVETMGLVTLDYKFGISAIPNSLQTFCTNNNLDMSVDEWKNFLKLILDYFVRAQQHIQYSTSDEKVFLREVDKSTPIRRSKFPRIKTGNDDDPNSNVVANQPRIILILCAGLGVHTIQQLQNNKNDINDILKDAYDWLCQNTLTRVYPNDGGYGNYYNNHNDYYYLDLSIDSNKAVIRRTEKVSVCPVTNTLLDTTFCGYSPLIIGDLSPKLCDKYKCTVSFTMPKYDPNNPNWLQNDQGVDNLKKQGLWNDRYDDVYQTRPPYLAAEHSAQQSHELLDKYVQAFRAGNINVLHCSTTMEMGVDIGDLDIVLMDTIPPTAANYLQRVGRAGRNGQTKALAFSLCNATPIGQNAFFNPTWWMGNSASYVPTQCNRHQSNTIIQRHINSYFLRNFLVSQGINGVTKIDDFMSPQNGQIYCGRFRLYLRGIKGNLNEENCYAQVFGTAIPFKDAVTRAEKAIVSIRNEYRDIMSGLNSAIAAHTTNKNQILALSHQMDSLMNIYMLQYLSEHQFIPNASMPTGIVTFNYMDLEKVQKYEDLMNKLKRAQKQLQKQPQNLLTQDKIQDKIKDLLRDIATLDKYSKASRDVRTALNEYVPGQTVVINEKNYKSAGVSFRGDYNQQTKRKVLYFCSKCGHTEYRVLGNDANTPACCPICNHTYHGIFDRKNTNFTIAYEPVEFMVDQNLDATRYEREDKEFYDIRPLFLDAAPKVQTQINMCDIAGSGEQGEILFYNAGHGFGFSICKKCGRAAIEADVSPITTVTKENTTIVNDVYDPEKGSPITIPHKPLWHSNINCVANDGDILRNVVLTGRQQTCYAVLHLYEDANRTTPCNDENLAYSLGVVVKYALAKYLKVDESEIDFGVKKERDNYSLFIYDTARGGCGYSLQLTDPAICQDVFGIARQKLLSANCNCEIGTGACPRCLVDRNSFRYAHKLSKALALDWLNKQQSVSVPLPANLANINTGIIYQSLKHIATTAAVNKEVKAITFCISDQYGCCVSDWLSSRSAIGSILQEVRNTAKQLNIKIEYDPRLHSTLADQYPYITLQVPDADVEFVKSLEDTNKYKTALIIEYANGQITRYFVDNSNFGSLSFSDAWGDTSYSFSDNVLPNFPNQSQPQLPPQPTEIVRTGLTKVNGFLLDEFYAKVIEPILQAGDVGIMNTILKGKVEISFSDPYVNSALASLMLVYLIKELKDKYHFTINNLTLTVDYNDRDKGFAKICYDYTYINLNFDSAQDADDYTESLCEQILGITPNFDMYNDPDHYRWIRFTNAQGKFVEIRMDYGISGGWQSRKQYRDLERLTGTNVYVDKKEKDILYYLIMHP